MDGKELYNLYEAYLNVYQDLDEIFGMGRRKAPTASQLANSDWIKKANAEADRQAIENLKGMFSKDPEERKRTAHRMSRSPDAENRTDLRKVEQVDLYDIILSHLLDEGYVETLEAAEAIMVNMSEEWRDSIIESIGTGPFGPDDKEDPRYDPEKLIKHYWNSRIFRSKRPDELPTRSKEDRKKQKQILRKMRIDRK